MKKISNKSSGLKPSSGVRIRKIICRLSSLLMYTIALFLVFSSFHL